jgi:hypothetical protein
MLDWLRVFFANKAYIVSILRLNRANERYIKALENLMEALKSENDAKDELIKGQDRLISTQNQIIDNDKVRFQMRGLEY